MVTVVLLVGLGVGRAQIARRNPIRTVLETVSIGIAAALAGVAIGLLSTICSPARWVLNRAGLLSVHDRGLSHMKLTEGLNVG